MNQTIPRIRLMIVAFLVAVFNTNAIFAQDAPPASGEASANLQVRYADARVRLARVGLEKALALNEKVQGSVPAREVKRLEASIAVAVKQLEIAKEYTHGSALPTQLTVARSAAKLAEDDVRRALEVNKKNPGMISELIIKELRVKAEMAAIRVELWKDPAYLPSLMDEMQWQIDRLTEQVIEVSQRLEAATGGR